MNCPQSVPASTSVPESRSIKSRLPLPTASGLCLLPTAHIPHPTHHIPMPDANFPPSHHRKPRRNRPDPSHQPNPSRRDETHDCRPERECVTFRMIHWPLPLALPLPPPPSALCFRTPMPRSSRALILSQHVRRSRDTRTPCSQTLIAILVRTVAWEKATHLECCLSLIRARHSRTLPLSSRVVQFRPACANRRGRLRLLVAYPTAQIGRMGTSESVATAMAMATMKSVMY